MAGSKSGVRVRQFICVLALLSVVSLANSSNTYDRRILLPIDAGVEVSVISLEDNNEIVAGGQTILLDAYEAQVLPSNSIFQGATVTGTGRFDLVGMGGLFSAPSLQSQSSALVAVPKVAVDTSKNRVFAQSDGVLARIIFGENCNIDSSFISPGEVGEFESKEEGKVPLGVPNLFAVTSVKKSIGWGCLVQTTQPVLAAYANDELSMPLLPPANELVGLQIGNSSIVATEDETNVTITSSSSEIEQVVLGSGDVHEITIGLGPFGGLGDGLRITADKPVVAASSEFDLVKSAIAMIRDADLAKRFGLPIDARRLAVVCPESSTDIVFSRNDDPVSTENASCGASGAYPGLVIFGDSGSQNSLPVGSYLEATKPVYVVAETLPGGVFHNLFGASSPSPVGADAPTLDSLNATTNNNPQVITGTAPADAALRVYVGDQIQAEISADAGGAFSYSAVLGDGQNSIYVALWDGVSEGQSSNTVTVEYINNRPRQVTDYLVSEDQVWTAGSVPEPYEISGGLEVQPGAKLTITKGAEFRFEDGAELVVNGALEIIGAENALVNLRSLDGEFVPNSQESSWHGIRVTASSGPVLVSYARIEDVQLVSGAFAGAGIHFDNASGIIENSIIRNNTVGVLVNGPQASPDIRANQIVQNSIGGYFFGESRGLIFNNEISESAVDGAGIFVSDAMPVIQRNSIIDHEGFALLYSNSSTEPVILNVQENWWGTTDPSEVSALNTVFVANAIPDFRNFLDGADGNIAPQDYLYLVDSPQGLSSEDGVDLLGRLYVVPQGELTISPGATIAMPAGFELVIIGGELNINGEENNRVTFTSSAESPAANDWAGVTATGDESVINISHTNIEYASAGVKVASGAQARIDSIDVRHGFDGLKFEDAGGLVSNCVIRDQFYGINVSGASSPVITNCEITNNSYGLSLGQFGQSAVPTPSITASDLSENIYGAYRLVTYDNGGEVVSLNARGNWWGTTSSNAIRSEIRDYTDFASLEGEVDFSDYLDSPGGEPVVVLPSVISSDTTFAAGDYTAEDSLVVEAGATLTIDPGVTVRFNVGDGIIVDGELQIAGIEANPVLFTSANSSPGAFDWSGIEVREGGIADFDFAVVEYASNGVLFENGNGQVTNSVVRENNCGIKVTGSGAPFVSDSEIYANRYGFCVEKTGTDASYPTPVVSRNSIFDNTSENYFLSGTWPDEVVLDARSNWWGSAELSAVKSEISDGFRQFPNNYSFNNGVVDFTVTLPLVNVSSYLDSAGGSVVANSEYLLVADDVTIPGEAEVELVTHMVIAPSGSLTIEPGATLRFPSAARLQASGNLVISGTDQAQVALTNNGAQDDLWAGVLVTGSSANISIDHAKIDHAVSGVDFLHTSGSLTNSLLTQNNYGVMLRGGATPSLSGNNITQNMLNGIHVKGTTDGALPSPIITGNAIHDNDSWEFYTSFTYADDAQVLDARGNWWGTTDPYVLVSEIYDYNDSSSRKVIVDVEGFLGAVGGDPAVPNTFVVAKEDRVLAVDSHYVILSPVTIPENVTLTINPGTRLEFDDRTISDARNGSDSVNGQLVIQGRLHAAGVASNPITFTSARAAPRGDLDWRGLFFQQSSNDNFVQYSIIEHSYLGLHFEDSDGIVSNNLIRNNFQGLSIVGSSNPVVTENIFVGNRYAMRLTGTQSDSTNPRPVVNGNDFLDNFIDVHVSNFGSDTRLVLDFTGNYWDGDAPGYNNLSRNISISGSPNSLINSSNHSLVQLNSFDEASGFGNQVGISGLAWSNPYFSPNGDGVLDVSTLSGVIQNGTSWSIVISDPAGTIVTQSSGAGGQINFNWNGNGDGGSAVTDGSYQAVVTASDSMGTTASAPRWIVLDTQAPVSIISDPAADSTLTGPSYGINGTASDNYFSYYDLGYLEAGAPTSIVPIISAVTGQVSNAGLGEWIISSVDGSVGVPTGSYLLRLTAYDLAGNVGVSEVPILVNNIVISNVSHSLTTIDASSGETSEISFDINEAAVVTLRIYPENDGTAQLDNQIRSVQQTIDGEGTYSFVWDGKDESGEFVADEAYAYTLTASNGTLSTLYDVPGGDELAFGEGFGGDGTRDGFYIDPEYNTHENDFWRIGYKFGEKNWLHYETIGKPARIRMSIGPREDPLFYAIDHKPVEAGTYTLTWDGRDPEGNIVEGTPLIWMQWPHALKPHSIIVTGSNPQISGAGELPNIEVKTNPYLVSHSYDQATRFGYRLDQASFVTIKLLPPGINDPASPGAVVLKNNVLVPASIDGDAGNNWVEWSGFDTNDSNKTLTSTEGTYTLYIEATSQLTGYTGKYRGALQIFN